MKNAWFVGSSSEVNTTHPNGSLPNHGYLHTYLDRLFFINPLTKAVGDLLLSQFVCR